MTSSTRNLKSASRKKPLIEKITDEIIQWIALLVVPAFLMAIMIGGMWYQNKVWHDTNDICETMCIGLVKGHFNLTSYHRTSYPPAALECACDIDECKTDDCRIFEVKTIHVK